MSLYLDTSVILSHFVTDANSDRADALLGEHPELIVISDLCATEFAAGLSRLVRMREITHTAAVATLSNFDVWSSQFVQRDVITPADWATAERLLRRLDLPLLTPDMLHVAVATPLGTRLATFDQRMHRVAASLSVDVLGG